jgi:iron(III) transport system substrate-binding protein
MKWRHHGTYRLPGVRLILSVAALLPLTGCWFSSGPEVVCYTALDRDFSEPVFQRFEEDTGIRVLAKYDQESNKTVGLTNALLAEKEHPRCDVFWNNEILNTLRLEKQGLLDVHVPPTAAEFPAEFRAPDGTWHGFAARARVLIVNTDRVSGDELPGSIDDLADPKWQDKVGIAKPLFGTTASHAACLFAFWGDEQAKEFFRRVRDNARIMSGNKAVAEAVGKGGLAFGLTDTDDAMIEKDAGRPVAIVYPDQHEGGIGTLFIPNTLAIIKGGPNPDAARRLVDYLLTPDVETMLAEGRSAQIPLHPATTAELRVETPHTVRAMQIDFRAAAEKWDTTAKFLRDEFMTPN